MPPFIFGRRCAPLASLRSRVASLFNFNGRYSSLAHSFVAAVYWRLLFYVGYYFFAFCVLLFSRQKIKAPPFVSAIILLFSAINFLFVFLLGRK